MNVGLKRFKYTNSFWQIGLEEAREAKATEKDKYHDGEMSEWLL